ncbi:MAG: class I SAM-dependent methyltransferase [Chloroflexota bacterium]|nr:class I SAM-dependent methyltransferase [Chloroflexota bacterium]
MHSFSHSHQHENETNSEGILIHNAGLYDSIFGHFLNFSNGRIIELAGIKPGDTVLDVGSGPGSLTLKAKTIAGQRGKVYGVDGSKEMVALAQHKASKAGAAVDFQVALAQELPFPDNTFDVVFSRLFIHHLPGDLKLSGFKEIERVLKPGGSCLVVDFEPPKLLGVPLKKLVSNPHRMTQINVKDFVPMMKVTNYTELETGPTGRWLLSYVKGRKTKPL